jgi:hypothetical protein
LVKVEKETKQKKGEKIMKTNLKRIVTVTVSGLMISGLLAIGVSISGDWMSFVSTVEAQEETKSDSNQFSSDRYYKCSNATLEGRYANIGHGFAAPPPNPPLPFATVSLMTLDGAGNLTNKVTRSNNGQISRGVDSGTYTVNADCTGTLTIATPNPPFQLTFDLVVADLLGSEQGREFYFIATTPGGVITTAAKRIQ